MIFTPWYHKLFYHGPCPRCGLHNDVELPQCDHCGYTFTEDEHIKIVEYAIQQKKKGISYGILVFGLMLALFVGFGILDLLLN